MYGNRNAYQHRVAYWRAAGGLRTIRWAEAFKNEYRWWDEQHAWDDVIGPKLPKLRMLPEEVQESNYGEFPCGWFKFDRFAPVRGKRIETWKKLRRLYLRRKDRQYRQKEHRRLYEY